MNTKVKLLHNRAYSSAHQPECNLMFAYLKVRVGRRSRQDAALALARVIRGSTGKTDVSTLTPGSAPRVLDLVEVTASGVSAIADSQDTMVQVSTASSGEDTRLVELEGGLISLNGDRDRLLVEGRHHGRIAILSNVSVGGRSDLGILGDRGLAGARGLGGAGGVRIVRLGGKAAVLLDPGEGAVHEATVATHVSATVLAVVTVNQVLLRERLQGADLVLVCTLKGTGGGERPARAALALVLDTSDGTGGNPVDRGGKGRNVSSSVHVGGRLGLNRAGGQALADVSLPLLRTHVGELVVAKGEGAVARVVGRNDIVVVGEVSEHLHEVLTRLDLDLVLLEPIEELLLVEGTVVDVAGNSGGSLDKV
jgi:hypothetical protein